MLTNVSSTIFSEAESITLFPEVSAEWNQNLFTPPYITVAGNGTNFTPTLFSGTVTDAGSNSKPNFTTKSFTTTNGSGLIKYNVATNNGNAYKIVTYIKTDNVLPSMVNIYAEGSSTQYGSSQEEISSLGWSKIVTYIGSSGLSDFISSFSYTIQINPISGTNISPNIFFTVPEIYETTLFDYKNNSLWPTDSVFTYFRPGESYVETGNLNCTLPSNYRKINSTVINGYTQAKYSPISSIVNTPQFFFASSPIPNVKNVLPTDISSYKYFISDVSSKSVTGIYEKPLLTNKIVIKFNTLLTIPTVNIAIDGNIITVDGSQNITPASNSDGFNIGLIVLYWNGTSWTKDKWYTMPYLIPSGAISIYTGFQKITVTQVSQTIKPQVSSYYDELDISKQSTTEDFNRMQIVEVSPRLEIDLSHLVESLSIEKSLDSQNSVLPLSSINTNSCNISLSNIPLTSGSSHISLFSSQSNEPSTLLANILRKNIKFYVNFNLSSYTIQSAGTVSNPTLIPGGIFYSDSWDENDIENVSIQSYDISRYLQSIAVPDYVANLKSVFEIITNILDLAGFTDYDYDSLYTICNNKSNPMDLSYFYCNSKDSTIVDTLNKIFVAYQIGAYIDEYGVMKFLSLHNILSSTATPLYIADANIVEGGFAISNKQKPGKISLRYQPPKVKQSPSLQNVTNPSIKNSPAFVYTTSNDVVWEQQAIDSVGFNYLYNNMLKNNNYFSMNVNDLLDIFHTYNRDANGYAFIDNEIVSFLYKEYIIRNNENTKSVTVSIKNDLELQAEINKFIKEYTIGMRTSYATITNIIGNENTITYTANNSFKVGDKVTITGVNPKVYCLSGTIVAANSTSFSILGSETSSYISGGEATIFADYDIVIEPTGNITNVKRGLFGTSTKDHIKITDLASKNLYTDYPEGVSIIETQESSLPSFKKIKIENVEPDINTIVTAEFSPSDEFDIGYQTYSAKFELIDDGLSAGGIFFNSDNGDGKYKVQLTKFTQLENNQNNIKYYLTIESPSIDSSQNVSYWADVTAECNSIIQNFNKIIKKQFDIDERKYIYSYVYDSYFHLKVVRVLTDGSDGEKATTTQNKNALSIYLNNIEITKWNEPQTPTNPENELSGWKTLEINQLTGAKQKPVIPSISTAGKNFGFYASQFFDISNGNSSLSFGSIAPNGRNIANLREIHATKKPLQERSVSYYFQDREFLNGLVQDQKLYLNSPTYLMQTTPEIIGINYYDVQYTTPAAVSVDVFPIEYMLYYFPGTDPEDQKQYQKKLVDEYSLSYSTIINTGFRAKMAIANNSSNLVFLHRESDDIFRSTVNFNLWTHEIVAPADPEILEVAIDEYNIGETVQLDSEWIQSKDAAEKMLKIIKMGIEGFSKDVSLDIFGNPLIQVGDIITLTYSLNGITQQKYVVRSVSHSFDTGLNTKLMLNRLQ